MLSILSRLTDRLTDPALFAANVIPWGCPVPSFGSLTDSKIATLGLNPSNREFVNKVGEELDGSARRFHTLRSLGLGSWSNASSEHLKLITDSCDKYFSGNPYNRWFRPLEEVISGMDISYYENSPLFSNDRACHLDLIPYATACKWTELTQAAKSSLFEVVGDTLAVLLRNSPIRVLILNGRAVVDQFESFANISLQREEIETWTLPRKGGAGVAGIAYKGKIEALSNVELDRELLILGFNHNLQSSYGVTNSVINSIREWVARSSEGVF